MIRITGMNSGLDTESIISELVSAQSLKKQKLVKAQKKLSWKQDTWKTLNSKVFSFHQKKLSDMRFSDAYAKKKTTVSNPSIATVLSKSNAADGVQTMKVDQLAKAGYLTGAKLSEDGSVKSSTTLKELTGQDGPISFSITTGGATKDINLDGNSTVQDVVNRLKDAGINANFDEKNQRLFLSAKTSGKESDFALTANAASGFNALSKLGINVLDTETKKQYEKVASMDRDKAIDDEVAARKANCEKIVADADANIAKQEQAITDLVNDSTKNSLALTGSETSADLDTLKETLTAQRDSLKTAPDGETDAEKETREKSLEAVEKQLSTLSEYAGYVSSKEASQTAKDDANDYLDNDAAKIKSDVTKMIDDKINQAKEAVKGTGFSAGAVRIEGQDAKITLNGAEFTSNSNTFSINDMTITALAESSEEVTLTTTTDYDGVYDTIKGFLKEYNDIINEISTLYNADSADKYEVLTSEERKAMDDDEVEEWDKKIKDSLLRKDSTLGGLKDVMTEIMQRGFDINGQKLYLSSFGINTGGYFETTVQDRYALHIDGDKDDEKTAAKDDKLKAMIASDPDTVQKFFQELSNTLYKSLQDKMGKTTLSSAMTFYNDIELKDEYDSYNDKISDQEKRMNAYEDKLYSKFSKMEVAMAKMQSKQNALSGFFGM